MKNVFEDIVLDDPSKYYRDYIRCKKKVDNSTAIYKGEPVDFLYYSLFFSKDEYKKLKKMVEKFVGIMDHVIEEYLANPQFRKEFAFCPLMEELILINPGYKIKFPVARFDLFYRRNGNNIFCELNTDGAAAMNEVRVIQQVMRESLVIKKISETYKIKKFELFYSWIDEMINNYREFCNNSSKYFNEDPNIAIMDFKEDGTIYEFKEFQQRMLERGFHTVICDPRELKYREGRLYYNNTAIDLIYRRATTGRLIEEAVDIKDFIRAYRNRDVCVVGGLVSQIIHNKKIFAILHNNTNSKFLTSADVDFIQKHIPDTRIFNHDEKLKKDIINQKNKWILKPFDKKAGEGVYAGRDFPIEEWQTKINNINSDYIVQEYVDVPELEMFSADNEKAVLYPEKYGYLVGLFLYNKKVKGFYTRAGRKSVIGATAESYTVPNYIYRRV